MNLNIQTHYLQKKMKYYLELRKDYKQQTDTYFWFNEIITFKNIIIIIIIIEKLKSTIILYALLKLNVIYDCETWTLRES